MPPMKSSIADAAPSFVKEILSPMLLRQGGKLPVSALPCDGTHPPGTARWDLQPRLGN